MAVTLNAKGTSVSSFQIGKGGQTISLNASGYLTIDDGVDTEQPLGYNTIPIYEIDAADTFDLAHAGMMWHKDSGAAVTFTCDNDATIPQGSTWIVHNDDAEDITIAQGTGVTIAFLASGAAPTTGNVTVSQGGIVTVYKYTDTEYWVWGDDGPFNILTAGATTDSTLRWNGTAWAENTTVTATSTGILTAASTAGNHTFSVDSATTAAAIPVMRLSASSSGTPAAGIGPSIELEAETAAANLEIGGTIALEATDVTATSEDFDIVFSTMAAGATAAERMRITSTGALTATTFNGVALTTGGASTNFLAEDGSYGVPAGTTPTAITVADSTDSTSFPAFFESATGDLGPKTDASNYTYNATTGALTAVSFVGALTGNADTATTATNATNTALTATNTGTGPYYLTFTAAATGNEPQRTDTGLTYNATTNALTTTTFVGALTGNADTATTAAAWTTTRTINMTGDVTSDAVNIDGSGNITITNTVVGNDSHTHDANNLTGTVLNSGVVTSSLTTVGTIGTGVWQGTGVGEIYGGTGQTTYTTGDILYSDASNSLAKLGVGSNGDVLTLAAGVPSWATPAGGGSSGSAQTVTLAHDSTNTMADPGTGEFRTSSGLVTSVTSMAFSTTDSGSLDISRLLDGMEVGSHIILRNTTDGTQYRIFSITSVTDNTTWYQMGVTYIEGNGDISMVAADEYAIDFLRSAKIDPGTNTTDPVRDIPTWSDTTKEWLPSGSFIRVSPGTNSGGRLQIGSPATVTEQSPQIRLFQGGLQDRYNIFIEGASGAEGFYQYSSFGIANDFTMFGARTGSTNTDLMSFDIQNHINITTDAGLMIEERAAALTNVAGYGQVWVKTATPNELWFTDDAGTDFQLGVGGSGTVTSVAAGNGLDFTTITGTGSVTLGTPGQITSSSTNAVTATSHTHAIDAASLTVAGIVELATGAETNTGTDATRAVTPDGLDDWTGSAQVTTLGTISSGTWEGTTIDELQGGTGFATYATGDILYASAANTLSKLTAGTNTHVLTLAAGVPTWAAPTTGTVTSVGITAGTLIDVTGSPVTTSGNITVDVDLSEATEAVYAPGTDYVLFLDGGVTGTAAKESGADFATALAGSGLTATSGVLAVDGAPSTATVQTTNATQTELLALAVASGTSVGFEALVMGRQDATGDTVLEKITGLISNEAGTTALIASPDVNRHETTGASTWVVTTAADDTSDELTFDVTGEASHTIDWSIQLTTIVI